jgi:hypothetical protein
MSNRISSRYSDEPPLTPDTDLPADPDSIDAVVLSHIHGDQSS